MYHGGSRIKTFRTRYAAKKELDTMRGWSAKVIKMFMDHSPDDTEEYTRNIDADGNTYVIQCGPDSNAQYLRESGHVE